MNRTKAPAKTPSPHNIKQPGSVARDPSSSGVFVSMVTDMTWRLAVVVLVPIIIGVELDNHYKISYLFLIIGLVLAVLLSVLVVYRSYKEANKLTAKINIKKDKNA